MLLVIISQIGHSPTSEFMLKIFVFYWVLPQVVLLTCCYWII